MYCTCKTNPFCEPCSLCTPPGVTCLTTCVPVDPCPEKINLDCVLYSGETHECSDITHLDPLSSVLLKILDILFPSTYCCALTNSCIPDLPTTTLDWYFNNNNCPGLYTSYLKITDLTTNTIILTNQSTTGSGQLIVTAGHFIKVEVVIFPVNEFSPCINNVTDLIVGYDSTTVYEETEQGSNQQYVFDIDSSKNYYVEGVTWNND